MILKGLGSLFTAADLWVISASLLSESSISCWLVSQLLFWLDLLNGCIVLCVQNVQCVVVMSARKR